MIALAGWVGAIVMVAASFNMATQFGPMLAVAGLGLLTIQSVNNRTHNLTALNIASILGFLYSLLGA
jgi:ABC-type microcin C transport system permease subunit YejB